MSERDGPLCGTHAAGLRKYTTTKTTAKPTAKVTLDLPRSTAQR